MSRVDLTRWPEIRERFDELVDLEAHERAARLAEIKQKDPDLGHAIERLIGLDSIAEERLQCMAFAAADLLVNAESVSIGIADPLHLSGRTISHFQIHEPIASGGMGIVYRAVDVRLQRVVALKFPLPLQAVDPTARQRFLREARSAGMLDHPNVCSVYEAGTSDDGHWYLAMPFYAGQTLKSCISSRGPLTIQEAVEITRQIAEGLACAHGAGIVHRDLKPGNVMVQPDGRIKILDFGLAKVTDLSRTASTTYLGTAAYMAPEQIRGDDVDGRTDLWAVGAMLYEMLVGERPISGENELSLAHAVIHQAVRRPSSLRRDIPHAVEAVILNLLQKDPVDRYPDAQALAADVATLQSGGKPAHQRSVRRRATIWLRSRGGRRSAAFVVFGILALATVAFAAEMVLPSRGRMPTKNAEAYELFGRAQEYEGRAWTMHEWNSEWQKAAETLYRRALELDPSFALARAELADLLATQQFDIRRRSPAGLEAVRREADMALELEPNLGVAHLVMSFYWEMRLDYRRSLAEAKLARRASPADAETHTQIASVSLKLGRLDDALAGYRDAARIDPKRGVHLARLYTQLRRYHEAAAAYDRYLQHVPDDYASQLFKAYTFLLSRGGADSLAATLSRVPDGWDPDGFATRLRVMVARMERRPGDALAALANPRSSFVGIYIPVSLIRGVAYSEAGDGERATGEFETARGLLVDSVAAHPDDGNWRVSLAQALAGIGRWQEAIRETESALALNRPPPHVPLDAKLWAAAASAFVMAREDDRAIDVLERLLNDPGAGLYASHAILRGDPVWNRLHAHPRFQRLLAN